MAEAENKGELKKLLIECYSDEKYQELVDKFEALFNPNKYSLKYEIEYGERKPHGTAHSAPTFSNIKPQQLSLEFLIDGTGVTTGKKEKVGEKIREFLKKVYEYDGSIHRNRYLRIVWGELIFDCILKSANITYTLFEPSGKPLRAKINAEFEGFVNDELREKRENKQSPDVTHIRIVEGGQRLDSLTNSIYRTPDYYIDVAKINGLVSFRKLKEGQELIFPPLMDEVKDGSQ